MDINSFGDFMRLVIEVWQNGYAGVDFGRYINAIGIFIGFLLIRRVFTRVVLSRIEAFAHRTSNDIDRKVLEALRGPLTFIPIVMGFFFATQYLDVKGALAPIFEKATRSMIVFTFFWGLFRLLGQFSYLVFGATKLNKRLHSALLSWISNILKVLVAAIGAAAILELWGINVGTLIAGLGLFGVAVALGAQDLFKNLIAGILILAESRFKNGDWIKVSGVTEGIVENIGFRSTRIRRFDKAPVVVPNTALSDNPVINFSEMTHRRIYWILGVEYGTSVDQLKEIRDGIEKLVSDTNVFVSADKASTFVRINSFGASSIDIMLYCFTQTTNWGEWLKIKEQLAFDIKEVVENAGTGFAFPSTSLYLEKLPEGLGKPEDTPSQLIPVLAEEKA
ncbi:mechanosensitive ion channel family protein [Rhodospirillaceae bacterium RKSG073]|nr:mechanosensitive ion channel family protein [Curvivirga aplysinae]